MDFVDIVVKVIDPQNEKFFLQDIAIQEIFVRNRN